MCPWRGEKRKREKKPQIDTRRKRNAGRKDATTRCRHPPSPDRLPRARVYHPRGSSFTIPISYRPTTRPHLGVPSIPRRREVSVSAFCVSFSSPISMVLSTSRMAPRILHPAINGSPRRSLLTKNAHLQVFETYILGGRAESSCE